jgi:hypothetical protein
MVDGERIVVGGSDPVNLPCFIINSPTTRKRARNAPSVSTNGPQSLYVKASGGIDIPDP